MQFPKPTRILCGSLGWLPQAVGGFPESLEPFQLGKFPPGWLAPAVGSSCSWCRGRCGTKCRPIGWLVGWLGDISHGLNGFLGETLGEALDNLGCFQVEEFMSTDELGDQLCWVLSELGMGFGHLVKLNAVLKVFPVVAIVGGKPLASNLKPLGVETGESILKRRKQQQKPRLLLILSSFHEPLHPPETCCNLKMT